MSLSPLQLEAGNVLLQNQGIRVAPRLTSALAKYTTMPEIAPLIQTLSNSTGILTSNTIANLETLGSNTCPALSDSVPKGYTTLTVTTTPPGFTGVISNTANLYMGNGDVGKFAQAFSIASSYVDSTNQFINAGVNSKTYLANTFSGMDNLTSADLTFVTTAPKDLASDLSKLGNMINLSAVDMLGSPLALVQQLVKLGGLTGPLIAPLAAVGLSYETIISLTDPATTLDPATEKLMYNAMTTITGNDLAQVLQILGVTTPNISAMSDLLDPSLILPVSYPTLITPTCSAIEKIYTADKSASGYSTYIVPYPGPVMKYGEVIYGYLYDAEPHSAFTTSFGYSGTTNNAGFATLGSYAQYTPGYTTYHVYTTTGTFSQTIYVEGPNNAWYKAPVAPEWGAFMQTYAIWSGAAEEITTHNLYTTINCPVAGTYTIEYSNDNDISWNIDNGANVTAASNFNTSVSTTVSLTAGQHNLNIAITNTGGPAGVAMQIKKPDGSELWNTLSYATGEYNSIPAKPATKLAATTSTANVNQILETELPVYAMDGYNLLKKIIPSGMALANKALSVSLQQITGITKMTLPQLAKAYHAVETNTGLPDIQGQTQPVPETDINYFTTPNGLATGSGVNGTILLTDVIGTAVGAGVVDQILSAFNTITSLNSVGALTTLTSIYNNMLATINGSNSTYNSGTGLWTTLGQSNANKNTSIDLAFTNVLIPAAQAEIAVIVTAHPNETTNMTTAFVTMANHIVGEQTYQAKANMDIGNLTANSQTSVQSFITSIPQYGKNISIGGPAEFLESVANVEIRGGQAIVATMREGRSRAGLVATGVGPYPQIAVTPSIASPNAILSSST